MSLKTSQRRKTSIRNEDCYSYQSPRRLGRPMLLNKDVCKKDMISAKVDPDLLEAGAADCSN